MVDVVADGVGGVGRDPEGAVRAVARVVVVALTCDNNTDNRRPSRGRGEGWEVLAVDPLAGACRGHPYAGPYAHPVAGEEGAHVGGAPGGGG
ncbi:hypothetical protein SCALM49S_04553 [Streptomyces californicus]